LELSAEERIKQHLKATKRNTYESTANLRHANRSEFQGNQFTVLLDSNKLIEATDNTIADAGKVGVWTKADSVTVFDDFSYGGK